MYTVLRDEVEFLPFEVMSQKSQRVLGEAYVKADAYCLVKSYEPDAIPMKDCVHLELDMKVRQGLMLETVMRI